MKLLPRKCEECGKLDIAKPGGCVSFRFYKDGKWERGYFHPKCFKRRLGK